MNAIMLSTTLLLNILTCLYQDQNKSLWDPPEATALLPDGKGTGCKAGLALANFDRSDSCRVVTVSRFLKSKSLAPLKKEKEAELIALLRQKQASNISRATACFILGEWQSTDAAATLVDLLATDLLGENTKGAFYQADAAEALIKMGKSINPLLLNSLQSDKDYAIKHTAAIILFRNLDGDKTRFESMLKTAGEKQPAGVKNDLERIRASSKQWTMPGKEPAGMLLKESWGAFYPRFHINT